MAFGETAVCAAANTRTYGMKRNALKVMRVKLPSDLSTEELHAAGNDTVDSPVEVFVTLPEDQSAGYLEMDLRPDQRYLYWTVPGQDSEPDGKVRP